MDRLCIYAILLGISLQAGAYTPYKVSLGGKKNQYIEDGVFIGGKAGAGSTLLKVRRTYSAKVSLERVIIDLGDKDAKPAGKDMGYFQVALDKGSNRLVIDLAQLRLSKVSESQLQSLFRKDPYIASAELTLDPEDKAGTMVLNFKRKVRVEVFQLLKEKQAGRIVVDVSPI